MKRKWLNSIWMVSKYFTYIVFVQVLFANVLFATKASGQKYSRLSEMNVSMVGTKSVAEIFSIIESQHGIVFSLDELEMEELLNTKVSLKVDENNLELVLLNIAKVGKVEFRLINDAVIVRKKKRKSATPIVEDFTDIEILGKVVDEFGEGLPGVTILLKGTTIGTISDVNGDYALHLSDDEGSVLVFRFLGYLSQNIKVSQRLVIDVQMELDITKLDDIVIVGYGTQEKKSITGSVAQLESKDILKSQTANVEAALVGRIPGFTMNVRSGQPGEDAADILIRGKGTLGDSAPLIVIDGVANRSDFGRLNSEDIESVTVLKDASAAIYGAQSANGVIVVTTKRGKPGSKQPEVRFNSSYTLQQPTIKPNLMDALQVWNWEDERSIRSNSIPENKDRIQAFNDGTLDPNEYGNTDWWSELTNKWSPLEKHSLSISGANDKMAYYVSGGILKQESIFKGSIFGYKQYNASTNLDFYVSDNLEIGMSLSGRQEQRFNPLGDIEGIMRGIYTQMPFDIPRYSNGLLAQTEFGNPVPRINGDAGNSKSTTNVLLSKVNFTLDLPQITEGLYLSGFAAYDSRNRDASTISTPYDIYSYNSSSQEFTNLIDQQGGISMSNETLGEISQTAHFQLGYKRRFGYHDFKAFAAYEQNKVNTNVFFASRNNLVSTGLPYLDFGSEEDKENGGFGTKEARQNYFGRFNYAYAGRYFLEFTMRYDGSQNFPEDNRFGVFPGVSLGWTLSEESFFNVAAINSLKMRASIGKLGNDRIAPYQYLQNYNVRNFAELERGTGGYVEWSNRNVFGENKQITQGLYPNSTPNPAVTWETSVKTNVGIDLKAFNGLLDVNFDLFYEHRTDILLQKSASVPEYAGFLLPDENIGIVNNKGFEVLVNHSNSIGAINYFINGQVSFARNEIEFMDEAENTPDWLKRTGNPIDFNFGYVSEGIYLSEEEIDASPHLPGAIPGDIRYADIDGDGSISADDITIFKFSPTPEYIYGIEFGADWKGLSMSVFFQGQANVRTSYRPWPLNQDAAYYDGRFVDKRTTPNPTYPGAYFANTNNSLGSDHWIRDNSFVRLKNVRVAYDFPKALLKKLNLTSLQVYVSGNNLLLIKDNVKIFDPESFSTTGWYYPQNRLISTGLSLTF